MYENEVQRRIFGPKTKGENYIAKSLLIFSLHQILLDKKINEDMRCTRYIACLRKKKNVYIFLSEANGK
jgi:hypothetical protein